MPPPFLSVIVHDLAVSPSNSALCAGYEGGAWRQEQFVDHLFEWLPEFALSWREREAFTDSTAVSLLRNAANVVYETDKYSKRGEFGELILHAAVRQLFNSEPAISKIFFKSAVNETVKGFDSVHVVDVGGDLELWLGEAKFYSDVGAAIRDVVTELQDHVDSDYLRTEALLIMNKIDDAWPWAEKLRSLLDPRTSLDEVFAAMTIPVLLTYDSPTIKAHSVSDAAYLAAIQAEVTSHWQSFASKKLPTNVRIRLILMPLHTKADLVKALHDRLETWQLI